MKPTSTCSLAVGAVLAILVAGSASAQAVDPGVRANGAGAGDPLPGLSTNELAYFDIGLDDFLEDEGVGDGLGPRFNLDSCAGCHSQPAIGGTSPAVNPEIAVATALGARNTVPNFLSNNGPIREVRFRRNADGTPDGGVHALFVTSGRVDDTGSNANCNIVQENFGAQAQAGNLSFRIPTPVFGLGLVEQIDERDIVSSLAANGNQKAALGISGRLNRNGNDGRVSRFGWKAQNQSGLLFAGEAYNVEMGISNEIFQADREQAPGCNVDTTPNDVTLTDEVAPANISNIERFAFFMRFLAAPTPSANAPGGATSIGRGRTNFTNVGCALCHTPSFTTGNSEVAALRNRPVNLFSDLAIHNMGPGLADQVSQGAAAGDEFRTSPLWGLGQRIFFLHDGRTNNLVTAIQAHSSAAGQGFQASEANAVIANFNALSTAQQQDLLNFLRSL